MPKINNGEVYPLKETLIGNDRFIGSDSEDNEKTKNFNLSGVLSYISSNLSLGDANIQSDWTEANSSLDSFIKNKPIIPVQNNKIRELEIVFPAFSEPTDQEVVDAFNALTPPVVVTEDELLIISIRIQQAG